MAELDAQSKSTTSKMTARCLESPHCTMGYMSGDQREGYSAQSVKALFNHAGRPVPADVAAKADGEKVKLGRLEKAGLFYAASRKSGDNVFRAARSFLYGL